MNAYGSKSGNGSWTGVVGLVVNGEADIGIADFTVTKERSEVVAFIDTLAISGYVIRFYIFYCILKFSLFV
jgi:ABC-type amino acid transport substrate-binding protein